MNVNWQMFMLATQPILILLIASFVILALGLFVKGAFGRKLLFILSFLSLGLAGLRSIDLWNWHLFSTVDLLNADPFAYFLYLLLSVIGLLSLISLHQTFERQGVNQPETYSLFLFAVSAMMLMVSTTNLLVFFLALEVMSLAIYILVGFKRQDSLSNEAALKYFILGAMVAGIFLYGMALFYGATGSFDLTQASNALTSSEKTLYLQFGTLLILVAFAFKVGAVPFHFWTPDVYEGAPVAITGWMSTAVKAAAFGAFIRALLALTSVKVFPIQPLLEFLSIATMVVGNLIALRQTNLKRMLAYSSIAHAGYVLVGVTALYQGGNFHQDLLGAPLFYLLAYSFMTLGAFAIACVVSGSKNENAELTYYAGLSKQSPALAALMALFMVGLTGIPPTVGFAGKFFLFQGAIEQKLYVLVIVGVLMSAVSAYYYLRVIVVMYFQEESSQTVRPSLPMALAVVLLLCMLGTIYFGLTPTRYLYLASMSNLIPSPPSFFTP